MINKTLLSFVALALLSAPMAQATFREWTGAAPMDSHWTTANNWVAGPPVAGDDLEFPSGARHPNNINDFPAGTTFNSISLRGGGTGGYNIGGNSIALNAGLSVINNSGSFIDHTVNNSLILNSNQTFTIIDPGGILVLLGAIDLNGKTLTFDVNSLSLAQVEAVISGAGGLIKAGAGTLTLSSNNTYTGATALNGGTLQINGSQPASPIVLSAGTLKGTGTLGTGTAIGSGGPGAVLLSPG